MPHSKLHPLHIKQQPQSIKYFTQPSYTKLERSHFLFFLFTSRRISQQLLVAMIQISSMQSRSFIILSSSVLFFLAAAKAESCEVTTDACQCSLHGQSGLCMGFNGDGTCLMGNCNEGYRCDCFGYEMCRRATCGKYTTAARVIPSEKDPFKCQFTPNAGTCTDFSTFMDTVTAADNAYGDAIANTGESIEEEIGLSMSIHSIKQDKIIVHDVIKKIEQVSDHIPDEEFEALEADAQVILHALRQANAVSILCTKESEETFRAGRQATKFRRTAKRAERQATQKEKQQKAEEEKAGNKGNCVTCETLKSEIKQLRKERKEASISSGTWAKKARGHKKNAIQSREKVKKIQLTAQEAREKCISRAQKLLSRLRG